MRCDFSHASVPGREFEDLVNLHGASVSRALVVPTAHTESGEVYGNAWPRAIQAGLVSEVGCYSAGEEVVTEVRGGNLMRVVLVA